MKLRYLALAAAVAFASPAWAATPTLNETTNGALQGPQANFQGFNFINPNPLYPIQSNTTKFTIGSAGLYSFWMAATSSIDSKDGISTTGIFSARLTDSLDHVIKTIDLSVSGNTEYFARYWADLNLAAGDYKINIFGAHFGGDGVTAAAAGVRAGNITAVPGPEAGAGLGALALGGMVLYMKRRRKEEAKAA